MSTSHPPNALPSSKRLHRVLARQNPAPAGALAAGGLLWLGACLAGSLAGCQADQGLDAEVWLRCEATADCPPGRRCEEEIGFCVPQDSSGAGPTLDLPTLTPERVAPGSTVVLTLSASRALIAPPAAVLRVAGGDRPFAVLSGEGAGPWVLSYTLGEDDGDTGAEAEAPVLVTAFDFEGRATRDAAAGSVTVDRAPPAVDAVAVAGDPSPAWVDSPAVALVVTVDSDADPPVAVDLAGDVVGDTSVPFAAIVPVTLADGDGPKHLTATFSDALGNRSEAFAVEVGLAESGPGAEILIADPGNDPAFDSALEMWINTGTATVLVRLAPGQPAAPASLGLFVARGGGPWIAVDGPPVLGLGACGGAGANGPLCFAANAVTVYEIAEGDALGRVTPGTDSGAGGTGGAGGRGGGEETPGRRATLTLHHDDQAPPRPQVPTPFLTGNLGSAAGTILLTTDVTSDQLDSGDIAFEVIGGELTAPLSLETFPLLTLPAVSPGSTVGFSVVARDHAGNAAPAVSIIVADDPMSTLAASDPIGGANERYGWTAVAGNGETTPRARIAYYEPERDGAGDIATHRLGMCGIDAEGAVRCGAASLACPPDDVPDSGCTVKLVVQALGIGDRALFWEDTTGNLPGERVIRHMALGDDGLLGTGDGSGGSTDGTAPTATIIETTSCLGVFGKALVYGRGTATSYFLFHRSLGADGIPGGLLSAADTVTLLPGPAPHGINPCVIDFDGRYLVYGDADGNGVLYDLGPDRAPETADDGGSIELGHPRANVTLVEGRLFLRDPTTGETSQLLPDAEGIFAPDTGARLVLGDLRVRGGSGDKLAVDTQEGPRLLDLSSGELVSPHNELAGGGPLVFFRPLYGEIFGAVAVSGSAAPLVARSELVAEPFAHRFSDEGVRGFPSGSVGDLAVVLPAAGIVFSLDGGQILDLDIPLSTSTDPQSTRVEVDVDGGNITWIDGFNQVSFYSFGPDGRSGARPDGTSDDIGPLVLTTDGVSGPGIFRWPRIDGRTLIFVELLGEDEDNGDWTDALDPRLLALDLGDDGIPDSRWAAGTDPDFDWSTGDDAAYDLSFLAGRKPTWPDVAGERVVFFDYAGEPDTAGETFADACELAGNRTRCFLECQPAVHALTLGEALTTAVTTEPGARAGLVLEGSLALWSELATDEPLCTTTSWDVVVYDFDTSLSVVVDEDGADEVFAQVSGSTLAYVSATTSDPKTTSLIVRRAGDDRVWGNDDDELVRRPCARETNDCLPPNPTATMFVDGSRFSYLGGGLLALGGGLMPVVEDVQVYSSGVLGLAIPITEAPLEVTITIGGPEGVWVEAMVIDVEVSDGAGTQLAFELVSPSGDGAALPAAAGGTGRRRRFTILNAPELLDHWAEPLSGDWTLRVRDTDGGSATDTLHAWTIRHRK